MLTQLGNTSSDSTESASSQWSCGVTCSVEGIHPVDVSHHLDAAHCLSKPVNGACNKEAH
jgi:hypothetical protein